MPQDNSKEYLDMVKDIVLSNIPKDKFNVFLFGSRAREHNRFAADIDIGIKGKAPVDKGTIHKIKDEIEESIVPFNVDIIDFYDVSDDFKKVALRDIQIWNKTRFIDIS